MSDEGHKFDDNKLRYDLVPPIALEGIVKVLTHGAVKYAPNNWQLVPDAKARYTAALMRHLEAWRKGELVDPDSGLPHMAHIGCNAMFLAWFDAQ
jgi:hypothetical protein